MRIAVLDDWQGVALSSADWAPLQARAEVVVFNNALANEDEAAAQLADFDVLMAMRERTAFPRTLVERLPRLKMFNMTGHRAGSVDMAAMAARGVTVCGTPGTSTGGTTAELALGLMLAAARKISVGDAAVRAGRFQSGTLPGIELAGKILGLIGLGRIGQQMARYGAVLGMEVLAWSQNLTPEAADSGGAQWVPKDELLARSDVISLHLVLSPRSTGIIGAAEFNRMKTGAILVNTSRGPLVEEAAMIAALRTGRITAALDVYDQEPLPQDHPLLGLPNTVLTPHFGYGSIEVFRDFYTKSIANVLAFVDGAPINTLYPVA